VGRLRVVIADDHPVVRIGLRLALTAGGTVEVVGEAADGEELVELAERTRPDVVVLDVHMPGTGGIAATRRLLGAQPGIGVLVLTMLDDDASLFGALRAGARGYLLKGADNDDVVRAVGAVARGQAIFAPTVASRLLRHLTGERAPPVPDPLAHLTGREREVLELLAQGLSNQQITRRLVLSPKTVRNHVSNVFAKLQVADRARAIVLARELGLGHAGPPGHPPRGDRSGQTAA
jgi:DNA-binding NarL/FixJ family response regulator